MITFVEARNIGKDHSDLGVAEKEFRTTLARRLRDIKYYPSDISPDEYSRDFFWRLGGWAQALSSKLPGYEKRAFWYTGQEDVSQLPVSADEIFMLSISCSTNYFVARDFIEKTRTSHPQATIIVGGLHANIQPEQTFVDFQPDLLFVGEADEEIDRIVAERDWAQPKIVRNLHTVKKESMDDDWELYLGNTRSVGLRTPKLLTSRDCPYRCNFCSIEKRGPIREIPASKIRKSLRTLRDRCEKEVMFYLESPVPFYNHTRASELLTLFSELGMEWYCDSRIFHPTAKTPELFEDMHSAGCHHVFFGAESAIQHVSDSIGKQIDVQDIAPLFRQAKNAGIKVHAGWIVGLPGQSEEDAKRDLEFLLKSMNSGLLDIAYYQYLTIYPNTAIFRTPESFGVILEGYDLTDIEDYPMYSTNLLSRERIIELYLDGVAKVTKELKG